MWHLGNRHRLERRAARAFGLKDYAGAVRALEDLLRVVGENPNTLHVLAVCRQRLGEPEAAIGAARRGLTADPAHLSCLKVLVEVHAACGELETARDYARRALALVDARARPAATLSGRLRRLIRAREHTNSLNPQDREWMRWARALCESNADAER